MYKKTITTIIALSLFVFPLEFQAATDYRPYQYNYDSDYRYRLDDTYRCNVRGALNRNRGSVYFNVDRMPDEAWKYYWGKQLSIDKNRRYIISFDAYGSGRLPISVRINQNYYPYRKMSEETRIYLTSTKQRYTIELTPSDNDTNAVIGIWAGHAVGKYNFSDITVTSKYVYPDYGYRYDSRYPDYSYQDQYLDNKYGSVWRPNVYPGQRHDSRYRYPVYPDYSDRYRDHYRAEDRIDWYTNPAPLSSAYWTNISGAIDRSRGTIDFYVHSTPDEPWKYTWGKKLSVQKGKRYILSFDAYASQNSKITLRLNEDHYPYDDMSSVRSINLTTSKKRHTVELYANETDNDSTISVWSGYNSGDYHYSNINLEVR